MEAKKRVVERSKTASKGDEERIEPKVLNLYKLKRGAINIKFLEDIIGFEALCEVVGALVANLAPGEVQLENRLLAHQRLAYSLCALPSDFIIYLKVIL